MKFQSFKTVFTQVGNDTSVAESPSTSLLKAADMAEGLSGRALRKLPFQAHAFYVQQPKCPTAVYMRALQRAVQKEQKARADLDKTSVSKK